MNTGRTVQVGAKWTRTCPTLPAWHPRQSRRRPAEGRSFLEAVLWRTCTGSPWRDLPRHFGNWNNVFKRFCRWALSGIFENIF